MKTEEDLRKAIEHVLPFIGLVAVLKDYVVDFSRLSFQIENPSGT